MMNAYHLVLRLSRVVQAVPGPVAHAVGLAVGAVAGRSWLTERRRLVEVIDRVHFRMGRTPRLPLATLIDRMFCHFALNAVELLRLPATDAGWLASRVELRGVEHLRAALALGRGVVLAVPHLGNWELLGAAIAHAGFPLHSFYLAQKEQGLTAALDRLREHSRIVLHDRDRGLRAALQTLRRGEILGMLPDQDGGNQGVYADFLGHWVSSPLGPANWSLRTGAAVVPLYNIRIGLSDRLIGRFAPALPPPVGRTDAERIVDRTRTLLRWMESVILRHPEQYLWFYDRFRPRHHQWMARLKREGVPMRRGAAVLGLGATEPGGNGARSPTVGDGALARSYPAPR